MKKCLLLFLFLMLTDCREKQMSKVSDLVQVAFNNSPVRESTGYQHSGFPIPNKESSGELKLYFLVCPSQINISYDFRITLKDPEFIIIVDPRTQSVQIQKLMSKNQLPGSDGLKPGQTAISEKIDRQKLYETIDILLPFYESHALRVPVNVQEAAKEYLRLWPLEREDPLVFYYDQLGNDWFRWVKAVSQ